MSNKESTTVNVEKVMVIKSDIEALLGQSIFVPVIPQKAMVQLTKLSMVDMTWSVLEETQIGFTVNDLRHASNNCEVKKKGKDLLKKWKKLDPVLVPATKQQNVTQGAPEKMKERTKRSKSCENKKGTPIPKKASAKSRKTRKVKVGTARIRTDGEGADGAQEDQAEDWSVQSVAGIKLILSKPKEQKASPVKKRKKRAQKMSFLAT